MTPVKNCILNKDTSINPIWLMRQAGRYLPEFREIRKENTNFIELCLNTKLSEEITLQPIDRFSFDAAIIFSDILMVPYGLGQKVEFEKNLVLDKIVMNKAILLDNIYYDLDKSDIRPDAAVELNKLVVIMRDNPSISIELSSHTDDRASVDYNQDLSQRRAESAVSYIIDKGINENRIIAKGYGESQPVSYTHLTLPTNSLV